MAHLHQKIVEGFLLLFCLGHLFLLFFVFCHHHRKSFSGIFIWLRFTFVSAWGVLFIKNLNILLILCISWYIIVLHRGYIRVHSMASFKVLWVWISTGIFERFDYESKNFILENGFFKINVQFKVRIELLLWKYSWLNSIRFLRAFLIPIPAVKMAHACNYT